MHGDFRIWLSMEEGRRKPRERASSPELPRGSRRSRADFRIRRLNVGGSFAGRADVLRAGVLHDFLCALDLLGSFAVDGQQNPTLLHEAFVPLRLKLRNAETDERAGEPTDGAADTDSCQSSHDRSSRD